MPGTSFGHSFFSDGGRNEEIPLDDLDEEDWDETLGNQLEIYVEKAGTNYDDMFCYSKLLTHPPQPCLQIAGVGMIGLPLAQRDAKTIISSAKPAAVSPADPSVNGVGGLWEIESSNLSFANPKWAAFVDNDIHRTVCKGLGIESATRMDLHKLTLNEAGSSYHSPQVLGDHAFVTVVILLPSAHSGAQVHLTNGSITKSIDFSTASLLSTGLLAWYSDVGHQVEEVTSGYRLSLTYRLVHVAPPGPSKFTIPERNDLVLAINRILRKWRLGRIPSPEVPYIAYVLDDKYSKADLKLGKLALKDKDAERLELACEAGEALGFKLFLANIFYVASGPSDDQYHLKRFSGDYNYGNDDEMPKMKRVDDYYKSFTHISDLDGNTWLSDYPWPQSGIGIDDDNFAPFYPFPFDGDMDEPDEVDFDGFPGEWDTPVRYNYKCTAIIIVHTSDMDGIFSETGGALYAFERLKATGAFEEGEATDEMRHWAKKSVAKPSALESDKALKMLRLAIRWNDIPLFNATMKAPVCDVEMVGGDVILQALAGFSFEAIRLSLEMLIARTQSFAGQVDLIYSTIRQNAAPGEEEVVVKWSQKECTKLISTYKATDPDMVPSVMVVARSIGLDAIRQQMLPNVVSRGDTYSFLMALIRSLRGGRQLLKETLIPDHYSEQDSLDEVIDGIISECLEGAAKNWSNFSTRQIKVDRVIEILEQAPILDEPAFCKKFFVNALRKSEHSFGAFIDLYVPLVPRLKEFISSHDRTIFSPPFLDIFRMLIGTYLRDVLGAKNAQWPQNSRRAASTWADKEANATAFLNSIGDKDVIKSIMGGQYTDVLAALDGSVPFGQVPPPPQAPTTGSTSFVTASIGRNVGRPTVLKRKGRS